MSMRISFSVCNAGFWKRILIFQNCDEACYSVPLASLEPIHKRQFHEQTVRVGLVVCERA
jgi:hypothetical protein